MGRSGFHFMLNRPVVAERCTSAQSREDGACICPVVIVLFDIWRRQFTTADAVRYGGSETAADIPVVNHLLDELVGARYVSMAARAFGWRATSSVLPPLARRNRIRSRDMPTGRRTFAS